ncbi:MAG: sugar transferase [Bacillota bacterium]|nr:sugar transferase [Bacillota bacterium]
MTDLIAERDEYGANDVPQGLTGWAQINGRDEPPIHVKARLDGEYAANLGLLMDIKCVLGTIACVLHSKGYSEGVRGVVTNLQEGAHLREERLRGHNVTERRSEERDRDVS